MKIAISADGKNIRENKVTTFCGCDFFLIVDTKDDSLIAVENENKGIPSEVGGIAGQLVSNEGIDAVIVSDIGLEALNIFHRYGINVYQGEGIINNAIRQLDEGRLLEITKDALQRYMKVKGEK